MGEELFDDDKVQEANGTKRERSPSFPYLDLNAAVEHTEKLFRAAKMSEVRVADVAATWGMKPKSGSLLRYVSALAQFGLLDTTTSGEGRKFRVSAAGRRILEDGRPGVREELLSEAALKPKLIRGLYFGTDGFPAWGRDRPDDGIAESALKFDMNFGQEAARRFLMVYDATIEHAADSSVDKDGVDTEGSGALESVQQEPDQGDDVISPPKSSNPSVPPTLPASVMLGELNVINFKSDGAGTVTISATLDAKGLEILEKKIAAFKMLLN